MKFGFRTKSPQWLVMCMLRPSLKWENNALLARDNGKFEKKINVWMPLAITSTDNFRVGNMAVHFLRL